MNNFEDAGYGGEELREDLNEMFPLLAVVHHFFARDLTGNMAARLEAMMDGLGYVYFCRNNWNKSTLLMSLEPDFEQAISPNAVAGYTVQQFWQVGQPHLYPVVRAFLRHGFAGRNN